jgi:serine/threonine-protein kinase HipA
VPEHRLIQTTIGRFFAVRRFDRPAPGQRLHLHSAAGLLHADFRTPGDEYDLLFRLTESLTRDYAQKRELFRRACLNVLACNRDDHLKNFAFLMGTDGVWRLAPLFDFTFHTGPNGWQTLSVAGEGQNPRREHLLKLATQVDLRPRDAAEVIEQVRSAVAGFGKLATKLKLSKLTTDRVRSRMNEIDS